VISKVTNTPCINAGDIFLQEGSTQYFLVLSTVPCLKTKSDLDYDSSPTFVTKGVKQFSLLDSNNELFTYYLTEKQFFLTFGECHIKAT
jgi:hypothetical protein